MKKPKKVLVVQLILMQHNPVEEIDEYFKLVFVESTLLPPRKDQSTKTNKLINESFLIYMLISRSTGATCVGTCA